MLIRQFLIYIILYLYAITAYALDNKGFDEICSIYTEAINSSMLKEQLSEYVFDNVAARVSNSDALDAHGSIFQLDPAERYSIFKQAAEMSLKRSWDCAAVKELME